MSGRQWSGSVPGTAVLAGFVRAVTGTVSAGPADQQMLVVLPLLLALLVLLLRSAIRSSDDGSATEYQPATREREHERVEAETRPGFLSGQGGARDKGFEIESKPPDADLSDHLDHLRAELGEEGTPPGELETLETVAEETESEREIPTHCPQEHCNAAWTQRTLLDITNGRYERLDDGKTVRCLDCEQTVTLD